LELQSTQKVAKARWLISTTRPEFNHLQPQLDRQLGFCPSAVFNGVIPNETVLQAE
jgi:hypothetical protein